VIKEYTYDINDKIEDIEVMSFENFVFKSINYT
jgi:hypothetical protein